MAMDGALAIILAIVMLVGFWKLNRHYQDSGEIPLPFSIRRDRTPRFFRLTMILNWAAFAFLALAFAFLIMSIVTAAFLD